MTSARLTARERAGESVGASVNRGDEELGGSQRAPFGPRQRGAKVVCELLGGEQARGVAHVRGVGVVADVAAAEVAALERVCILFDGNDEAAVGMARGQWKALTDAGIAAQYWSEASGRWEMKAQAG